ncbi:serine/threonine-protein kinase [Sphingomonas sp. 1P06PA]|uniref:serine/threonine-protein kinase n=1 Tax=Sphingomonas sp. 1P06PA TaxID=554121 RepID=UPI0039A7788E
MAILDAALELPANDRAAWLEASCADHDLRAKVQAMLALEDDAAQLMPTEAGIVGASEIIPDRVGPFRIDGVIGRGGMGTVLRAERDDGVYQQTVAIKLIRAGLHDAQAAQRFAQERRILARLDHPAIARILDGGTSDGRPWLAMEHVDGAAITTHARADRLSLADRLALFREACAAVQAAHRQLIVHADIKPSNILVRSGDGQVKLLDFGIARLVDAEPAIAGGHPLTRVYAAPERIAGEPPTVSGDVYGLGILLHELLTGRLPGRIGIAEPVEGDGSPLDPGAVEMLPSAVAADPAVPASALSGDIDAIVIRAIAAQPANRYPDVGSLIADLDRHLGRRPVLARGGGRRYRAGRFIARNRLPLAIGIAVFLALAIAAIVSTTQYRSAARARAAADLRFEEVRALARFQLFDLYDQLVQVPGTVSARAKLAEQAQTYLEQLVALPGAAPDLRLEVARGFDRLAEVQGVPRSPNLGQPDRARAAIARSEALLATLDPARPAVAREIAVNRIWAAQIATWLDFKPDQAAPLLIRARAALDRAGARDDAIEAQWHSAELDRIGWSADYSGLEQAARRTLASFADRPPSADVVRVRADALNAHGDAVYYLGRREEALADYRAADALLSGWQRGRPPDASIIGRRTVAGYNVATTLEALGRTREVPAIVDRLVAQGEVLVALEPADQALRRRHLVNLELAAQIFLQNGRNGDAQALQRRVIAAREADLRARPGTANAARDVAFSRMVLGTILWTSGVPADGCAEWRAAHARFAALEAAGDLAAHDRGTLLPYLVRGVDICSGRLPPSAFRPPG